MASFDQWRSYTDEAIVEEETDKAGLHASISGLDVLLDNGLHIHVSAAFVHVVSDHELRPWAGWGCGRRRGWAWGWRAWWWLRGWVGVASALA